MNLEGILRTIGNGGAIRSADVRKEIVYTMAREKRIVCSLDSYTWTANSLGKL